MAIVSLGAPTATVAGLLLRDPKLVVASAVLVYVPVTVDAVALNVSDAVPLAATLTGEPKFQVNTCPPIEGLLVPKLPDVVPLI